MTFSIIVSTMNQTNTNLLNKLNVNSDAVVVNQCGSNREMELVFNNKKIKWIDSDEKGLSKSRNRALKEVKSDIVLMVDDDETLYKETENLILSEFERLNADLIAFNINGTRDRFVIKNSKKINIHNAFRYGSARLAFKMDFINRNKIKLNEDVGAGTPVGCGEDSIFIRDFLKNKGRCFSSPVWIADICDDSSTWFAGYDEKFFINKAIVYKIMFPKMWKFACTRYLCKHYKITKSIGFFKTMKLMFSIK